MKKLLLLISIIFFSTTLCYSEDKVIKIGAVLALTGPAQAFGTYAKYGIELAEEELEKNGYRVEVVFEDSQSTSVGAVSAIQKLIKVNKVEGVIGDVWGFFTNPLSPIVDKAKIPLISPTVVKESFEKTSPYVFTNAVRVENSKDAVIQFFNHFPSAKTIGIFCWGDPWGKSYSDVWKTVAQEKGLTIVKEICNQNDYTSDFRTDALQISAAKPDLILISHLSERILQRLAELKYSVPILSTGNIVGVLSNGTLSKSLSEGVYFTDWSPSESYLKQFREKFGRDSIMESHNSYEALKTLVDAIKNNPSDPASAIRQSKRVGVAGLIDFTKDFSGNYGTAQLYQIHDGKGLLVK
jgi:ABC-type branched-subunit amino acid transport system substrate-binding protein